MPDPSFETFLTSRGLTSLCQKECHLLVKNWILDDSFHRKWPVLVILVPVMIRPSGSEFILRNHQNSCWILAPFLSEAVEAVWGQKSFKWWIRHKFPLLRKPLSISFWYICQNIWSSQVFTLCQNLTVDPVNVHALFSKILSNFCMTHAVSYWS